MSDSTPKRDASERGASHREQKKARVRRELVSAALRLFSERGFETTTIDEIAADVGLVRRTFFHYFPTKHDVLFGWYEMLREQVRATLAERPRGEGALTAALAALAHLIETGASQNGLVLVVARLSTTSPELHARLLVHRAALQRELVEGLAARLPRSEAMTASFVAAIAMTATWSAVEQRADEGETRTLPQLARTAFAAARRLFGSVDETYVLR